MRKKQRIALQIFGLGLLAVFCVLLWRGHKSSGDTAQRGEEVYASHDCTDCHLPAPILRQKGEKKEVGLIRVRKDMDVLIKFLSTDKRHESFRLLSDDDRRDLVEFLRLQ